MAEPVYSPEQNIDDVIQELWKYSESVTDEHVANLERFYNEFPLHDDMDAQSRLVSTYANKDIERTLFARAAVKFYTAALLSPRDNSPDRAHGIAEELATDLNRASLSKLKEQTLLAIEFFELVTQHAHEGDEKDFRSPENWERAIRQVIDSLKAGEKANPIQVQLVAQKLAKKPLREYLEELFAQRTAILNFEQLIDKKEQEGLNNSQALSEGQKGKASMAEAVTTTSGEFRLAANPDVIIDQINTILTDEGISYAELSRRMGKKNPANIRNILKKERPASMDLLFACLSALNRPIEIVGTHPETSV